MLITWPSVLLIVHALVGVTLLGAITHQLISMYLRRSGPRGVGFIDRYTMRLAPTDVARQLAPVVMALIRMFAAADDWQF